MKNDRRLFCCWCEVDFFFYLSKLYVHIDEDNDEFLENDTKYVTQIILLFFFSGGIKLHVLSYWNVTV